MRGVAVALAALSGSCASTPPPPPVTVPVAVTERLAPPADLLTCPDAPPHPGPGANTGALALALGAALEAGQACRDRVAALREWVGKRP